jgi:aerobic carbon-monoxide dehydrogenase large subunit
MLSLVHGRGMTINVKLGLTERRRRSWASTPTWSAEGGAYPAIGAFLTVFTQHHDPGRLQDPRRSASTPVGVVTNTTTTAAYRGAGRPEATQMLERLIDVAADELGIDPAELRRRNFLQPSESFPLTTHGGANYDSGEYEKALDAVLEHAGYPSCWPNRPPVGPRAIPALGIGVSAYVEVTAPAGLHVEYGAVEINDDGTVTARVGTSAHGQGHETAFSMIIADMLGVPWTRSSFCSPTPTRSRGVQGTMGSRSLQTAGSAVHVAARPCSRRPSSWPPTSSRRRPTTS